MEKGKSLSIAIISALFLSAATPYDSARSSGSGGDTAVTINKAFLPTPDELQKWSVQKDAGGPTFAGSPSWKSHMAFLEKSFQKRGLTDIKKDFITYERWFTSDDRTKGDWSLTVEGKKVSVASYWAYSGSTPPAGTKAALIYYDAKNPPPSIAGKIVVFDTPPMALPPMYKNPGFEYASDPDTLPKDSFALDTWYQVTYYTRFGKFSDILTKGKAAGALVIADMSPGRAAGTYTIPLTPSVFGIAGLYLDREAGKVVRQAAKEGRSAILKLIAQQEKAEPYFLAGFLAGKRFGEKDDEIILLISHTDGPNISQENGALGILAVIEYFSRFPQNKRPRTLLLVLDPQHYMPGRHAVNWYELHPEAADKIVASIAIEHLGQREYREEGNDFFYTGLPEVTQLFVQNNDNLIKLAVKAVKDNRLPRTMVQCPSRKGQGPWIGMGAVALKRHIPGYGISANANAYWSTEARIDKFDKDLAWKQIAVAAQLISELMQADLKEIAVP